MAKYKVEITNLNTNNIKVLKNKEMVELFKKYQSGDLNAKEELINGNLKLVLSILRRYNNRKYNMDDLFQIGCVGLIKAVDNFDLSHEVKFSTYAVPLILGEVKRFIRDNNTSVRVSRSIKELAYRILTLKEEYFATHGVECSNKYVSEELDIAEYEITNALDSLKEPMSIYDPIYDDGGDTIYLIDQIANKTTEYDYDMILSLRKSLNKIKKRERDVLVDRYIIGKTQTEIANKYNISQAQVSRIEKNAISSVKKLIK